MQIRIFSVSSSLDSQDEFNKFLRGHKILSVDKIYDQARGYWTFAVEYMEDKRIDIGKESRDKIDYKNLLTEEEFARFSEYRQRRKNIAKEEALPAYAIFTDKELAEMAKIADINEKRLLAIDGINTGRASRFGNRILEESSIEALNDIASE